MKNRRYVYVGSSEEFEFGSIKFKTFSNFNEMRKFAKDEKHNGTYTISAPDITFKYKREQILDL